MHAQVPAPSTARAAAPVQPSALLQSAALPGTSAVATALLHLARQAAPMAAI